VLPDNTSFITDEVSLRKLHHEPMSRATDKVLRALDARAKGDAPRFGPKAFPAFDFGERIRVEPPDPGDMRVGPELEASFPGA